MKNPGRRPQRVAEAIREVVASFLQQEARDPRIGFVTVTAVRATPDLKRAIVTFVAHGDAEAQRASLEGLTHAAVAIRRELGRRLRLRTVPEVVFEPDRVFDQTSRIDQLLASLHKDEGAAP